MDDERERWSRQPAAHAWALAVGAFALFMVFMGLVVLAALSGIGGGSRLDFYLLFGAAFFCLAASIRLAAESIGWRSGWRLPLAGAALVYATIFLLAVLSG
jgi:hypothetical protein